MSENRETQRERERVRGIVSENRETETESERQRQRERERVGERESMCVCQRKRVRLSFDTPHLQGRVTSKIRQLCPENELQSMLVDVVRRPAYVSSYLRTPQ